MREKSSRERKLIKKLTFEGHGGHEQNAKSPVILGFFGPLILREKSLKMSWLGCQDSNLGMTVSKTVALPLGDTPI